MKAVAITLFHVAMILMLVLFRPFPSRAQEVRMRTGETHTGVIAACANAGDAATLIGLTTRYGRATAMGWMNEPDNTCAIVPATFTVGDVELDGMKGKDGTVWMVLGVTIEGKPAFMVAPSVLFQSTSY